MKPYQIYQQQQAVSTTRIDLLLALYDKAHTHLSQALHALTQEELSTATSHLFKAQVIVYALASGVDPNYDHVAQNMLRLYEFMLHCLSFREAEKIQGALQVLTILREGLRGIESKARNLELSGKIPPLKATAALRMSVYSGFSLSVQ